MLRGDRRALARLLSLLDINDQTMASISKAIHPHVGKSYCMGITGPPGAGKSTIVDCLIKLIRKDGQALLQAVLFLATESECAIITWTKIFSYAA